MSTFGFTLIITNICGAIDNLSDNQNHKCTFIDLGVKGLLHKLKVVHGEVPYLNNALGKY